MLATVCVSATMLALSATMASADNTTQTGAICMQRVFMGPTATLANSNQLNCTANDVSLARAISVSPTTCTAGATFTLNATFQVNVTANSRYDTAYFFRIDGGANARGDGVNATGQCSMTQLDPAVAPALPNTGTSGSDGDSCGDLNSGSYSNVVISIPNVLCQDSDGDGFLNLPNCTSWHSNAGTACNRTDGNAFDANPDTKSKCVCDDTFQVPVVVQAGSITVTKDSSPASLPEPGGEFTYTVTMTNTATVPSVTIDRICDDRFGLVKTVAGQPACSTTGLIGTVTSTTCVLPQTLAPNGGSYSCEFKASLAGLPITGADTGTTDTVTDTATVFGHDSNTPPKPVSGSDTAQVKITNVPPSLTVVKSLDKLACADLDYKVKVTNTDSGESISLTTLTDSAFGDLTKATPDNTKILSTSCAVPQTLEPFGAAQNKDKYECTFRAHVCLSGTSSHTNTATGTVTDNEGGSASADSNSLTVNVCANTASATCP
jgi:hypothetical protein